MGGRCLRLVLEQNLTSELLSYACLYETTASNALQSYPLLIRLPT